MRLAFILGVISFLAIVLVASYRNGIVAISNDNTGDILLPDGTSCVQRDSSGVGYVDGQIIVGLEDSQQYTNLTSFLKDYPDVKILETDKLLQFGSQATVCFTNLASKESLTQDLIHSGGKVTVMRDSSYCFQVKYPDFTGRETVENVLKPYAKSATIENFLFSPYNVIVQVPSGEEKSMLQKIKTLLVKYSQLNTCGAIAQPF